MKKRLPARKRERLVPAERKRQLLQLGLRLFSERAYDDISIEDIAAAAGISPGLLYHYFPNKRVLYVETVRAAAAEMIDRTRPPKGLPLEQMLTLSLDAYLDYVESNAKVYESVLGGGLGADPEVAAIVEATRAALARRTLKLAGVARPTPILKLAVRGWLGFIEAAVLEWLRRPRLDREALRALLANAMVAALAAAGPATPGARWPA